MVYSIWMWEGVCQTGVWKPGARSIQGIFAWAKWRIQLQQNVSWIPDSMKFSNIYRVAKVERCVDCLVKKVIELQLCSMNFSKDGRYMLSRTRQLLLQHVWNTVRIEIRHAIFYPLPMAKKNSYYHKYSNYQDCLHSATV